MNTRKLISKFEKNKVLTDDEIKVVFQHYENLSQMVHENALLVSIIPFVDQNYYRLKDIIDYRGIQL